MQLVVHHLTHIFPSNWTGAIGSFSRIPDTLRPKTSSVPSISNETRITQSSRSRICKWKRSFEQFRRATTSPSVKRSDQLTLPMTTRSEAALSLVQPSPRPATFNPGNIDWDVPISGDPKLFASGRRPTFCVIYNRARFANMRFCYGWSDDFVMVIFGFYYNKKCLFNLDVEWIFAAVTFMSYFIYFP